MARLSRDEVARRMQSLSGWTLAGDTITREFVFDGFPAAVQFVDRLVPEAEKADHHPDIEIHYQRVRLTYSTHSEGGLTDQDFAAAIVADRLA